MAPLRRYLRLTPHSVLEVRIYLDNPADLNRWLLHSTSPVLPRVLEAVRPLVGPKLREENERAKAKKGKGRGVKDVVVRDDFEVSIFLTELSTTHALLKKQKFFLGKKGKVGTVGGKMTGSREVPVEVGDEAGESGSVLVREESREEKMELENIPAAGAEEEREGLFVSEDSEGDDAPRDRGKNSARENESGDQEEEKDGKKKMAMGTTYDGFRIYGRILCLVVKRKGIVKGKQLAGGTGQAVMEEWIASTQMGEGRMMDD